MMQVMDLESKAYFEMCQRSVSIAEAEFDERLVLDAYDAVIGQMT